MSFSSSRLCSVAARGRLDPFLKGGAEAAFTVKANTIANFLDGEPCVLQKEFSGIDARGYQIFVGGEAGDFFKNSRKIVGA